jgi:Icc protein
MEPTVRFIHLTDLHIVHPGHADPKLKSDTSENLRAVRALIEQMDPPPAFIAVSGDLTNHGDVDSFRTLRELMDGIGAPVLYALGNHDSRAGFYQGMLDRTEDLDEPYNHETVIDGVHIITLDSTRRGRIGGYFAEGQLEYLAEALDNHPDLPKLLMFHHGPSLDLDPAGEWECLSIADSNELADVIDGYDVVGMLTGHLHMDRVANWHGVPVILGMSLHCALDPLYSGDGIRSVSGVSFTVCDLRPSGLSVTFSPLPSDRQEVSVTTMEQLRAYEAALSTAA